jgi:hypothetical protein
MSKLANTTDSHVSATHPEKTMQTISIPAFGGPEQLRLMDMPQPRPADGEALVKLDYAGISACAGGRRAPLSRGRKIKGKLPL